ncbi:WYL domain-containing protein [Pseudoalteromonas porphyrae]|uniref:Uncharacterized protein n=1 Tax=Pseudoalteromonas porphyrae TaxID=187330 RepID=A0A0N0LZY3_9GAMM|nr:WYL domain-containing protein [Pseudoalteromonas porphyrae]KPH63431.1 hypothetical protein ADS77_09085 [Pseudoalteromonas porphyrae]
MTPQFDYITRRRFNFIELIIHWEGRLTTNHLQKHFAISRSSASNIIQDYIQFYPQSLRYNSSLKGYEATKDFSPCLIDLDLTAYLKLANQGEDTLTWQQFTWLSSPLISIEPHKIRGVLRALNQGLRVDVGYASVSSPEFESRIISPHNLIFDGMRWHVRAYCEKNSGFRDFVLTRFNGECEFEGGAQYDQSHDTLWQTQLTVVIEPDPRLTPERAHIIALDHQMTKQPNGRYQRKITVRAALLLYLLKQLHLDSYQTKPEAQQIILSPTCLEALKPYMAW